MGEIVHSELKALRGKWKKFNASGISKLTQLMNEMLELQ
jgi:hypothetical protein